MQETVIKACKKASNVKTDNGTDADKNPDTNITDLKHHTESFNCYKLDVSSDQMFLNLVIVF